jgi:hypothetical protein
MYAQADIDSAFRRVPVHPQHRQYAHVVFKHNGETITARHLGLPFGAVASVHHWERVGELIKAVARRLLHLPVLRYAFQFRICTTSQGVVDTPLVFMLCQVRRRLFHGGSQQLRRTCDAHLRKTDEVHARPNGHR